MDSSDPLTRDVAPAGADGSDGAAWTQHHMAPAGNVVFHDDTAGSPQPAPYAERIRILMLAANPISTSLLALGREARDIEEKLRLSRDRDSFEIVTRWAVRPADLQRHLNEIRPHIVHFSGHGSRDGDIVLSDDTSTSQTVSVAALTEVFRVMRDNIRVVMLNACYTAEQAQAIGAHIDYVVGMRTAVDDTAAIVFSAAFYSALGYGRSVVEAFEQAKAAIGLHGLPGNDTPQLLARTWCQPTSEQSRA